MIEEGQRGREQAMRHRPERVKHEAAACDDLRQAARVKRAVDALAVALAESDAREVFGEMHGPGPIGDALNYDGNGPLVDLHDLCRRTSECDAFDGAVRSRAGEVLSAVDAFVLSMDAPDRWRSFRWYTPLVHEEGGKEFGRWAFLRDGAVPGNGRVENWFELLDLWFDEADEAGGINGYRI